MAALASSNPGLHGPCFAARRFFGRQTGAQGKAATNAFGRGDNIGRNAIKLMRIQRAGAGNATLHFVEHQQDAVLVGQFAQAGHEFLRSGTHAAFALDRLDHEGGGLVADSRFGPFQIVKVDIFESGEQGREAEMVAIVRPWKAFLNVIISNRSLPAD